MSGRILTDEEKAAANNELEKKFPNLLKKVLDERKEIDEE